MSRKIEDGPTGQRKLASLCGLGPLRDFALLREEFRARVQDWMTAWPGLAAAQTALARANGYDYALETPIVYNRALDTLVPGRAPRIVLVADNPGLNEQRAEKRAYLVGQSGRLAEGFFSRELGLDFRADAIILNKTPVHTPKTKELAGLLPGFAPLLEESQRYMAGLALRVAAVLDADIWIIGYSELGPRGLFRIWADAFRAGLPASGLSPERILVFRHFSMNQFSADYYRNRRPDEEPMQALRRIGSAYRRDKLGIG